ncbi:MAG: hypothetical protein JWP87_733 [Labilithrix sp.]|nr:hypothetical protein [Labilithrix sp.]
MHGERQSPRLSRLQVNAHRARALVACFAACAALAACARSAVTGAPSSGDASAKTATADGGGATTPALDDAGSKNVTDAAPIRTQLDDDGNDDPEDPGQGTVPESAHFTKVGTPPLALTRICDLTPFGDALYAAHANQPLGTDGATITRYRPDAAKPFGIAFDWNRPGEPVKGGGAGQGFLRVHAIGGRLFVADADPPYNGLGLVEYGTEGYVFVSDRAGSFAPPRAPHYRPPGTPDLLSADGRAGAAVLPRAYHVIDVVKFRGGLYASTGSVPPKERAWHGASPGALHRASDDGSRWTYEVDYPYPWQDGVWRLTFMVRFRDRLYAGIQDYDGRDPNDYLYFAPSSGTGTGTGTFTGREAGVAPPPILGRDDVHPVRVTRTGAAGTLRWWVDTRATPARLYWLAWSRDTGVLLRVTSDGDHWAAIPLPADAGRPTDVTRFRDSVVVLTEGGLYRLTGESIDGARGVDASDGVASVTATAIARALEGPDGGAPAKNAKSPFEVSDFFCVAPLAVFKNELYAGGQRGGSLYRLEP